MVFRLYVHDNLKTVHKILRPVGTICTNVFPQVCITLGSRTLYCKIIILTFNVYKYGSVGNQQGWIARHLKILYIPCLICLLLKLNYIFTRKVVTIELFFSIF